MNTKKSASSAEFDDHLTWLVNSRSVNQASTLALRKILYKHSAVIEKHIGLAAIATTLLEINFSLWRAVFLSDLEEGTGNIVRDAKKFIDELIENNTITYSQDKGTREFTFLYYMDNAKYRLKDLNMREKKVLSDAEYSGVKSPSDRGWWEREQAATNTAIANFGRHLDADFSN